METENRFRRSLPNSQETENRFRCTDGNWKPFPPFSAELAGNGKPFPPFSAELAGNGKPFPLSLAESAPKVHLPCGLAVIRVPYNARSSGIVKIVFGSFFLFLRASHTILTTDPAELDLHTLLFSWFLCPVLYGISTGLFLDIEIWIDSILISPWASGTCAAVLCRFCYIYTNNRWMTPELFLILTHPSYDPTFHFPVNFRNSLNFPFNFLNFNSDALHCHLF
jgi:hypothetical protein